MYFLELWFTVCVCPEVGLLGHARGEGERVLALESGEGTRASRRVEEGLSRFTKLVPSNTPVFLFSLNSITFHPLAHVRNLGVTVDSSLPFTL